MPRKKPAIGSRERPAELSDLPEDDQERFLFLISQMATKDYQVSLEAFVDFKRLQAVFRSGLVIDRFGPVRFLDAIDRIGKTVELPMACGPSADISTADIRYVSLSTSRECPRARPSLPPGTAKQIERRCRELAMLTDRRTVLYVGRQAEPDTCCGFPACECFAAPVEAADSPAVTTIPDTTDVVLVCGQRMPVPSPETWELLRRMCQAFPDGLSLGDVRAIAQNGKRSLVNLAKKDARWAAAIVWRPGKGNGGYRIRSEEETRRLMTTK
jgi:hypothetical protein